MTYKAVLGLLPLTLLSANGWAAGHAHVSTALHNIDLSSVHRILGGDTALTGPLEGVRLSAKESSDSGSDKQDSSSKSDTKENKQSKQQQEEDDDDSSSSWGDSSDDEDEGGGYSLDDL